MDIIIDTNFVLACIENKADIFDLEREGDIIIPREVIDEIEKIKEEGDLKRRQEAEVAIKIIAKNKEKIRAINLGDDYVDRGIDRYIEEKKGDYAIATLDKELIKKLKGKVKFVSLVNRKKFVVL